MKYAKVVDAVIVTLGAVPVADRRLDTGGWILGLRDASEADQQACGWFPVTSTPRPADTASTTFDYGIELVAGTPTEVWTERPKTSDELDNDDRDTKLVTVAASIATLRQWAVDAASTNVTNGNNTAVTQTVVDRLGVFFDRFADLIEAQRLDK